MLKTIELFAGIGGFRVAADDLGMNTIWANDIDDKAVAVYRDNYGENSIIQGDINNLINEIPDHDFLTGGFPCQPFSKAGKKQGIADYRGTLFEAIVNILKLKNPRFFVLENVNSLLFMKNGENYRTILSALSELDYKIEWRVFNAIDFGLPQHRERVIITGTKNRKYNETYFVKAEELDRLSTSKRDEISHYSLWKPIEERKSKFKTWGMALGGKYVTNDFPEIHQNVPSLSSILEENVDSQFDYTENTLERIKNSKYVNKYYNGVQILYNQAGGARMGYSIFGTEGTAPTLTASTSRHYERYKVGNQYRRLTNVEYARLQGFSDDHCKAVSVYDQYKLYGNAVPHQIVEYAMKKLIDDDYIVVVNQSPSLFDFMEV